MADEIVPYLRHLSFVESMDPSTIPPSWAYSNDPIFGQGRCYGVAISFRFRGKYRKPDAHLILEQKVKQYKLNWLRRRGNHWAITVPLFRDYMKIAQHHTAFGPVFDPLSGLDWIEGTLTVEPDVDYPLANLTGLQNRVPSSDRDFDTLITFLYRFHDLIRDRPMRIFLSHKGVDKPMVRNFFKTLKALGFDPWLDEDAMTSGTNLERGLLQGFKDSCAAVFFITKDYQDKGYLATEVEYALVEERNKGDKFKIITIVFKGKGGTPVEVPELLRTRVWKTPSTPLEALREIIKALPIELGSPVWR